ncbi:MAG TPA: hypothetical protein VLB12_01060 [Gemmatimonadales bacterium]|nr:hypothetical protein [Gemmatimonadales bacterium]
MSDVIPFTLKVAGKDHFQGVKAVSTSYRFRGLLRFDGASLWIEWTGTYRVQEVGALTARDEEAPLPVESLSVPLARVLNVRFRGGWLRPRLELSGRDLAAFETVPGEDGGVARLWLSRRDRVGAEGLATRINRAIDELDRAISD